MNWLRSCALRVTVYSLLLGPIIGLLLYAFSQRWFYPQLLPNEWTSEILLRQLTNPRVQSSLTVSLVIAGLSSLLSLVIGYPAARALTGAPFRGRNAVLLFLALPGIVPPVATGMGLNIIFLRLELAGTLLGVILVHLIPVLPYSILTLVGVLARYDEGYEQQATVLGAAPAQVFSLITLRLLTPGLLVAGLFAFLVSWSQYLLTLLVGGGRVITLPLLLFSATAGGNPTTIATLALIFVAPPILVIALVARSLTLEQAPQTQV
ncbi:MAG: ABC transporter permease subunit [Oscillochloris sp.]|nr:ABC transporter permease subunit [Oscillochloris sp.]